MSTGLHPRTLEIFYPLIRRLEGVKTEAYLDAAGIPTICAGLTTYPDGTPVRMGDVCSAEVCEGYLRQRLEKEFIPQLLLIPGFSRFGPHRQAALLSFAFNVGAYFYGHPEYESITKTLRDAAKDPELYRNIPNVLRQYNMSGGKPVLTSRREQEIKVWLEEDPGPMEFQALQDTFLKKAPIDSRYLSDEGRQAVKKGDVLNVVTVEAIAADSHAWVDLEGKAGRWAIFSPHFRRINGEQKQPGSKVNWNDFNARVSKHLTVGEVLQYDRRRMPRPGSQEEANILRIAREFDAIREAWKGPIGVTSGYRPEPINRQVGGVPGSYHVSGQALDIYPIGESLQKMHEWLVKRWSGGYGDGRHRGFIHLDTRGNGRFHPLGGARPAAIWTY